MVKNKSNTLSGINFFHLLQNHFHDIVPNLSDFNISVHSLTSDRGLALAVISIVSYYCGVLAIDTKETRCYNGPTVHRISHLLKAINSNNILRLLDDDQTVNVYDWTGRQYCYDLLKHLGLNTNQS